MSKILKSTNIAYLIYTILLIVVFSGCTTNNIGPSKQGLTAPNKDSFSDITPEEAKERLDNENLNE